MDKDLEEALDAIKQLRAELWLAYEKFEPDSVSTMPVSATEAMDQGKAVLRKHNSPDDMMDIEDGA